MTHVPVPAQDSKWDEPIQKATEPLGGWDKEWLKSRAMSLWGLSYDEAEQKLLKYGAGRLTTLLDQEVKQRFNNE